MILTILTPEKLLYTSQSVVSVTLPSEIAVLTIYNDHAPLVSQLIPGELLIEEADGGHLSFVISTGVVIVKPGDRIELLVETAEKTEDIDVKRAEEAVRKAEKLLLEKEIIDSEEFAQIEAKMLKELARVNAGLERAKRHA